MSKARNPAAAERFDLFLPYIAELPLRDQREMMERPFFSLAKSKRIKPIDYTSPDGQLWVHVSANPNFGMATIWDADILIYCASVLADMARRGANDVPRKLHIMPYDLLRAIGRPTTGRAYELLGQSLDRLVSTTIKTNIRAENRREATFSWLDGWTQLVDEKTERSRGMTLELSNWFWEGVMMKGGVLAIDRAYFDITGGRERWLYKVARKHAGGAGDGGFAISMPVLFEKSGAEGEYRRFKFEILKLAEKDALPGYGLSVENGRNGEPLLRMRRVDGKDGAGRGLGAGEVPSPPLLEVETRKAIRNEEPGDLLPLGTQVSPGKRGASPDTPASPAFRDKAARAGKGQSGSATAEQRESAAPVTSIDAGAGDAGAGGQTAQGGASSGDHPDRSVAEQRQQFGQQHDTRKATGTHRGAQTAPAAGAASTAGAVPTSHGGAGTRAVAAPSREVEPATFNASGLIRSAIAGLTTAGTRGFMTDATIDHLRETCPGWDLHALHADFERWVAASPDRTPADWQRAFVGWVKRHHARHKTGLRG